MGDDLGRIHASGWPEEASGGLKWSSEFTSRRQPEKRRIREEESLGARDASVFLLRRRSPAKLGDLDPAACSATTSGHVETWPRSAGPPGQLNGGYVFRVSSGGGSPEGTVAKTTLCREKMLLSATVANDL